MQSSLCKKHFFKFLCFPAPPQSKINAKQSFLHSFPSRWVLQTGCKGAQGEEKRAGLRQSGGGVLRPSVGSARRPEHPCPVPAHRSTAKDRRGSLLPGPAASRPAQWTRCTIRRVPKADDLRRRGLDPDENRGQPEPISKGLGRQAVQIAAPRSLGRLTCF